MELVHHAGIEPVIGEPEVQQAIPGLHLQLAIPAPIRSPSSP